MSPISKKTKNKKITEPEHEAGTSSSSSNKKGDFDLFAELGKILYDAELKTVESLMRAEESQKLAQDVKKMLARAKWLVKEKEKASRRIDLIEVDVDLPDLEEDADADKNKEKILVSETLILESDNDYEEDIPINKLKSKKGSEVIEVVKETPLKKKPTKKVVEDSESEHEEEEEEDEQANKENEDENQKSESEIEVLDLEDESLSVIITKKKKPARKITETDEDDDRNKEDEEDSDGQKETESESEEDNYLPPKKKQKNATHSDSADEETPVRKKKKTPFSLRIKFQEPKGKKKATGSARTSTSTPRKIGSTNSKKRNLIGAPPASNKKYKTGAIRPSDVEKKKKLVMDLLDIGDHLNEKTKFAGKDLKRLVAKIG